MGGCGGEIPIVKQDIKLINSGQQQNLMTPKIQNNNDHKILIMINSNLGKYNAGTNRKPST